MDTAYGREYRRLYEQHWWWRAREELVVSLLERFPPRVANDAILDVGCGDGLLFDRLERYGPVEGVEPDLGLLSERGLGDPRIHKVPFDDRFRPDRRFGRILMLDVLEHLPEPAAALRHVARLLEPGGVLVCTVPSFMWLWTGHDELNRHYTRYTRAELVALAAGTGLQVEWTRYFFHWLTLPKLAVRAVERLQPAAPSAPRVPSRVVNALCYRLSRAEARLLTPFGLPFGSSLGMVARRPAGGDA